MQPGDEQKEREGSASRASREPATADSEAEDNPFRPPADLRAEDESARKKRKTSIPEKATSMSTAANSATVKTEEQKAAEIESAKNKISFSIKGRASAAAAEKAQPSTPKPQTTPEVAKKLPIGVSPLVQSNVPKSKNYEGNTRVDGLNTLARKPSPAPPQVKAEKVRRKRLKARPELSEEFSQSESVYFRRTGNDSVVGSGTYGKVYKAIHVYTGGMVALKKIRMEGERDGVSSGKALCLNSH